MCRFLRYFDMKCLFDWDYKHTYLFSILGYCLFLTRYLLFVVIHPFYIFFLVIYVQVINPHNFHKFDTEAYDKTGGDYVSNVANI